MGEAKKSICINASNLHIGGAVQVAVSFLIELSKRPEEARNFSVIVSTQVDDNLKNLQFNKTYFASYKVMNVYGFSFKKQPADYYMEQFRTVFTIFGPLYRWNKPFYSVVGFAQPWIIYPRSQAWSQLNFFKRIQLRLKFKIQCLFFRKSDQIIVELEHARTQLVEKGVIPKEKVSVIHNCLSRIFLEPNTWGNIEFPTIECDLKLGYLGRNYTHKSIELFAPVANILRKTYGINAKLIVTFSDEEWQSCSKELRSCCVNVGPLKINQCPSFYQQIDAVFFPSLLECFSATPLEAMSMKKHIFMSDLPFNRDVCCDFASYSPINDVDSFASKIVNWLKNKNLFNTDKAQKHAITFSSPSKRAEQYIFILKNVCSSK